MLVQEAVSLYYQNNKEVLNKNKGLRGREHRVNSPSRQHPDIAWWRAACGGDSREGCESRDEPQHEAELHISRSLPPSEGWRGQCSNQLC